MPESSLLHFWTPDPPLATRISLQLLSFHPNSFQCHLQQVVFDAHQSVLSTNHHQTDLRSTMFPPISSKFILTARNLFGRLLYQLVVNSVFQVPSANHCFFSMQLCCINFFTELQTFFTKTS